MAKTSLYLIECKSNLHAGSGDSNYGIIDKQVQRDVTDDLPCIYASSLKGALREFFEEKLNDKISANFIFGEGENKGSSGTKKGFYVFDQAMLFSIPVRSNIRPFFHATAPLVAEKLLERMDVQEKGDCDNSFIELLKQVKNLNVKDGIPLIINLKEGGKVKIESFEECECKHFSVTNSILGESFVVFSDNDFIEITDNYNLPVIARNKLDNGKSKNLWYEQVVPRESKFTFFVDYNDEENKFQKVEGQQVQIGSGSSIGYGYCKIIPVKL